MDSYFSLFHSTTTPFLVLSFFFHQVRSVEFSFFIEFFFQSKLSHIGESRMEMDYKLVENEGLFQEYLEMGKNFFKNYFLIPIFSEIYIQKMQVWLLLTYSLELDLPKQAAVVPLIQSYLHILLPISIWKFWCNFKCILHYNIIITFLT